MMKLFLNLLLLLPLILPAACSSPDKPAESDANILLQEVKGVSKLNLAQMSIKKMANIDDLRLRDANGVKQVTAALLDAIKIGDRVAVYSYNTYLSAYIDLSQLQPDDITVDPESRHVTLTLPPIQIEYSGRDAGITEEHYRVTGLRSAIGSRERAELKEKMNDALKAEVAQNDEFAHILKETARQRANSFFSSWLSDEGYSVTLQIRK